MTEKLHSLSWFVLADKSGNRKWKTLSETKGAVWTKAFVHLETSSFKLIRAGHKIVPAVLVRDSERFYND